MEEVSGELDVAAGRARGGRCVEEISGELDVAAGRARGWGLRWLLHGVRVVLVGG